MLLPWHPSALWCPERHGGKEENTQRNNAGKLEPGYSAQFDAAAAASNRHEQEKSIRLTGLLSKGLPPWERVEGVKAFGKKKKQKTKKSLEESELERLFVVLYVRSTASDPHIWFLDMFAIPFPISSFC